MKRCIDCGFLFAVVWSTKLVETAEFDPGLLRNDEVIEALRRDLAAPEEESRSAAQCVLHRELSIRVHTVNAGPHSYCWRDVHSIRCLRMGFEPMRVRLDGIEDKDIQSRPVATLRKMGDIIEPVLRTIFDEDRRDCLGYFPYEPGLSADQHSQLLIQTRRAERQRIFQIKTLAFSLLLSAVTAFIVSVVAPRVVDRFWPPVPSKTIVLTPTPEASPTPTAMSLPQ